MRKLAINIVLFLLPFLAGVIFLFLIPVNKKFNYHFVKGECDNRAAWIYQRIFEQPENIDIVFSGASQTSCGVMDEFIENEISAITGQEIKVANLGYCRRGRDIQYVMLKDLFQLKKPKVLVIEVAEDEPKKSHPVFPYLAESGDLWGSFVFLNQRFPANIWKGVIVRFEYLKNLMFQDNSLNDNRNTEKYGYMPSEQIASADVLQKNKADWENRLSKPKPELIRNIELNYSKHYLKKIVELARQNNCEVMFLYLPESGSNLKFPLLKDYYESLGKLIVLPDFILTDTQNWKDATHFNDSGALESSEFIANQLILQKSANHH
ncbi:MAG: hypothetical protein EP310_10590 [Bacteroidetes bacterium]|nr:MAG: hypothetical protein EP310_10590 [Bacteroidota bacterium]